MGRRAAITLSFSDMKRMNHYRKWAGYRVNKRPDDLMIYQQILFECKPELIIEAGTERGGSTLFFAHMLDLIGCGQIVTIDVTNKQNKDKLPKHPRIDYLDGRSTGYENVDRCRSLAENKKTMVVLDSDHHYQNVKEELAAYTNLVSVGQYLVVEDTAFNGHGTNPNFGPGPWEAVEEFLPDHPEYEEVPWAKRTILSSSPRGWMKKTK